MRCHLQTATNKLEKSLEFYRQLDFKVLSSSNPALVTDGQFVMEINPDRFARACLKFYQKDWNKELEVLGKHTKINEYPAGHLLASPCGVPVILLTTESPITNKMKEALSSKSFGLTGNFAGVSLESSDMKRSIAFWQVLGFEQTMGDPDQGWVAFKEPGGMGLSLMKPLSCPHLFFNPSLTFFNGKENLAIISKVRERAIPIAEEITHFNKEGIVDNIILRDAGGFGMFLFND